MRMGTNTSAGFAAPNCARNVTARGPPLERLPTHEVIPRTRHQRGRRPAAMLPAVEDGHVPATEDGEHVAMHFHGSGLVDPQAEQAGIGLDQTSRELFQMMFRE